jgi:hypothetical protein
MQTESLQTTAVQHVVMLAGKLNWTIGLNVHMLHMLQLYIGFCMDADEVKGCCCCCLQNLIERALAPQSAR